MPCLAIPKQPAIARINWPARNLTCDGFLLSPSLLIASRWAVAAAATAGTVEDIGAGTATATDDSDGDSARGGIVTMERGDAGGMELGFSMAAALRSAAETTAAVLRED